MRCLVSPSVLKPQRSGYTPDTDASGTQICCNYRQPRERSSLSSWILATHCSEAVRSSSTTGKEFFVVNCLGFTSKVCEKLTRVAVSRRLPCLCTVPHVPKLNREIGKYQELAVKFWTPAKTSLRYSTRKRREKTLTRPGNGIDCKRGMKIRVAGKT